MGLGNVCYGYIAVVSSLTLLALAGMSSLTIDIQLSNLNSPNAQDPECTYTSGIKSSHSVKHQSTEPSAFYLGSHFTCSWTVRSVSPVAVGPYGLEKSLHASPLSPHFTVQSALVFSRLQNPPNFFPLPFNGLLEASESNYTAFKESRKIDTRCKNNGNVSCVKMKLQLPRRTDKSPGADSYL